MAHVGKTQQAKKGQRIGLFLAGVAVFWVAVTFIGGALGVSHRTLALFDLMALAGFGYALWVIFQLWRERQTEDEGES